MVYRPSYRHYHKIFIVAWITYIYVWQRFEKYFSHHRAKWIDLFPLYIGLTRKLALFPFGYTILITIKTFLLFFCYLSQYAHDVVLMLWMLYGCWNDVVCLLGFVFTQVELLSGSRYTTQEILVTNVINEGKGHS